MTTDADPFRHTRPDFRAAALIAIDMQRDFLDNAPAQIPGTTAILPQVRALVDAFRGAARPLVHVVRIYLSDGSNVDVCRRAAIEAGASIVRPGTPGFELAEPLLRDRSQALDPGLLLSGALQPLGAAEWAIYKPRWGAFYRTRLEEHLREIGATTLVFAGCNFPNCPRTSIYEASERDFRVVLVEDAVSGLYEQGRLEMRNIGVALTSTIELLQRLREADTAD